MSGQLLNPLSNVNKPNAKSGILDMHGKIKKNNPIRGMTDVIGEKVYPRAKTKMNLPLGW